MTEDFEPIELTDEQIETQRTAEVDELLEKKGVSREQLDNRLEALGKGNAHEFDREEARKFNAALDEEYPNANLDDDHVGIADKDSYFEQTPTPDIFADIDAAAELAGADYAAPAPPIASPSSGTFLVPYNGGAGVEMLDLFRPTVMEYSKVLSKEEVGRITAEFKEALQMPTALDTELKSLDIIPKDELTPEQTSRAGEIAKIYKNITIKIEHSRKFLKERSLRTGQLIDGLARDGKDYSRTRQEMADSIYKAAAIKEAKRIADLHAARVAELTPFVENPINFALGTMPDEQYQLLLDGSKAQFDAREKEKAEQRSREGFDRALAAKKLERVNRLSALGFHYNGDQGYVFADAPHLTVRQMDIDSFRDDTWFELIDQLTGDIGDINDAKAEAKRIADSQAATDKENARIAQEQLDEINAKKAEAAKAEEAKRLAPDKEKLLAFAAELRGLAWPKVESNEANLLVERLRDAIGVAAMNLESGAEGL